MVFIFLISASVKNFWIFNQSRVSIDYAYRQKRKKKDHFYISPATNVVPRTLDNRNTFHYIHLLYQFNGLVQDHHKISSLSISYREFFGFCIIFILLNSTILISRSSALRARLKNSNRLLLLKVSIILQKITLYLIVTRSLKYLRFLVEVWCS